MIILLILIKTKIDNFLLISFRKTLVHDGISLSVVSRSTFCSKQVRNLRISSAKAARSQTLFGVETTEEFTPSSTSGLVSDQQPLSSGPYL